MTSISAFNQECLKTVAASTTGPGPVLEGTPEFKTFMFDQSRAKVGLWQVTPGSYQMVYGEKAYEVFTILEGVAEITEEGGEPRVYRVGETVVLGANFRGTWRTIETVKKVFISF